MFSVCLCGFFKDMQVRIIGSCECGHGCLSLCVSPCDLNAYLSKDKRVSLM